MLTNTPTVAFVATIDAGAARAFYEGMPELELLQDDGFALVFRAGGRPLRVVRVEAFTPQPFTVFGWEVEDVGAMVEALTAGGVVFLRFEGMEQDERGVWSPPGGGAVAWFRDPDGNVLSVSGGG